MQRAEQKSGYARMGVDYVRLFVNENFLQFPLCAENAAHITRIEHNFVVLDSGILNLFLIHSAGGYHYYVMSSAFEFF